MGISCHRFIEKAGGDREKHGSWLQLVLGKADFLLGLKSRHCYGVFTQSYVLKVGAELAKFKV
jgi:hypothetical protein